VRKDAIHLALVPSFWKIVWDHCCFFFLRFRNAACCFPIRS
jgi:hypothetical protein